MSKLSPCVIHIINSGGIYGAEKVLLNLCKHQAQQSWQVKVILLTKTNNSNCPLKKALSNLGIETIDLTINKFSMLISGNQLIEIAKKQNACVLHSHGYFSDIMLAIRSKRPSTIACVSTFHGWNNDISWKKKMWWYEQINAKSAIGLDQVISVTEAMRKDNKLPKSIKKSLAVIHNGIEFSNQAAPNDHEVESFCKNAFIFCAIGRLVTVKGFDILIKAFANSIEKMPSAKLLIIGEGKDREKLEKLILELNIKERILLTGFKDNAANYLTLSNCLVMSSLSEGLPITILEAMYSNKPIIATKVGEIPHLLNNNRGTLIEANNVNSLEKALINHYEKTNKIKLENKNYVENNYSAKKMASEYIELYQQLLNEK